MVSSGDCFQDPLWITKSVEAQVPYIKWHSIVSYPSVSVDAEPVGTGWTVLLLPLESYIFVNSGKVFLYKHITLLAYAVS